MLATTIRDEMKTAMKARDALTLSVMRDIITAFTNELVAKGKKPTDELKDEDAIPVLKRLYKQRLEAAEQFEKGGRTDLAEKERKEGVILENYLPAKASGEDIERVVKEKMAELGITDKTGMGKLIGAVMKELGASADGNEVKEVVAKVLS